jgi:hypothetical protein
VNKGHDQMGSYTLKLLGQKECATVWVSPILMKTGFLFAEPSIWSGAGRLLDLGCTFDVYNYSPSDDEADAKAIYSDWAMVGSDIVAAIGYHDEWASSSQSK